MSKLREIIVNPTYHDFKRSFILIKPSRPFYIQGQDYQIICPFTGDVLEKARLVNHKTYYLSDIPEHFTFLYRDLNLQEFKTLMRRTSTDTLFDVLLFSCNSYYHDFYCDKKKEIKEFKANNQTQMNLQC